jgi:putative aldouronate transport system substrate-binding protein
LAFANDLYAAGVMPPDALTYTTTASDTDFVAGKFSMYDGIWTAFKDRFWPRAAAQNPLARLTATTPFSADGQANPQTYARATGPRATYLKKASDARIKEVLGVLNFLAAPFGTQEDALLTYGVKDVDYTFDDQGNPVPNPQGLSSTPMPWRNLASPPPATFSPVKSKEFAQLVHPAEQTLVAAQAPIAVDGLYSATDATRGAALAQMLADAELAIVSGRSPVSSWDQTVQDWRAQGGDQTRGELEQLLAAGV